MMLGVLAERLFSPADQESFAAISGDRNPIHLNPIAARRTLAKQPIVHGIHILLWGLESLYLHVPDLPPVASIKVSFEKMIPVGSRPQAVLVQHDAKGARIDVFNDGGVAMIAVLTFGDASPGTEIARNEPLFCPNEPAALTIDDVVGAHGRVSFFSPAETVCRMFPASARALGNERIAGLVCSSFIVGMVCPGLFSIFRSLDFARTTANEGQDELRFEVAHSDVRFRLVRLAIAGAGWTGSISAHVRPEPVSQPSIDDIALKVDAGEFKAATAFIIGGSRGLGELVCKILAAGGADVILTYSVGEADARRVQSEIAAYGGRAEIMRYDVREGDHAQLRALRKLPNQMYYMATPPIARSQKAGFQADLFEEYFKFYVTAFYETCKILSSLNDKGLSVFYPSTAFVESRPDGMTEYAMAKAAGEVLCADMQSFEKRATILMRRLPRLPTDQTSSLFEEKLTDSLDIFIGIVRLVHASWMKMADPNGSERNR